MKDEPKTLLGVRIKRSQKRQLVEILQLLAFFLIFGLIMLGVYMCDPNIQR